MKKKTAIITKKKTKNKQVQVSSGFTLIELLATIAILSVITSIIIYFAINIVSSAKKKSYQVTINNVEAQAGNYMTEDFSSLIWMPGTDSSYHYQCVTVQNLIDAGYFSSDILESKIGDADTDKVNASDYVYLERDSSTKTITKNILLSGTGASYAGLCSRISATGRINMDVNPAGWIRDKKIVTINYRLYNYGDIDKYVYDYVFENNSGIVVGDFTETVFTSSSEKQLVEITENGTLCAKIKKISDGSEVVAKCQDITGIDNVAPTGTILSTNNVAGEQTVTLIMTDSGSGVSEYYFGKSNPNSTSVEWVDVTNASEVIETTKVDSEGKYYLGVRDVVGNQKVVRADFYKTILSIENGSVTPSVIITKYGNSFRIPNGVADAYYTFKGWYINSGFAGRAITKYQPVLSANYTNTLYGKTTENRLTGGVVTITGTNTYGETLTASVTEHTTPQADKYAYQWYYNTNNSTSGGTLISGATTTRLVLQKEHVGKYIYVVVTATKNNYRSTNFANKTSDVVSKRPVTVLAISDSKVYDGTALKNNGCSATFGLLSGHSVSCTMTSGSTITDVGSVDNVINTVTIKDSSGNNYNDYYTVTKLKGTLTVTKKTCICNISDYSDDMEYPGKTTGTIKYSCTGDGSLYVESDTTSVITVGTAGSTSTQLTAKSVGISKITVGRGASTNYEACSTNQSITVSGSSYTIEYYTYDGNNKIGSSSHSYDVEKELSTMSSLKGSAPNTNVKFYGWSTSSNSTSITYTDGQKVKNLLEGSGTIKLYAVWRSDPVQITYYSGVNKAKEKTSGIYYYYNNQTSVSITTETPDNITYWSKVGWRDDSTAGDKEYSYNVAIDFSSSKSLYAVYDRTLTINYDGNGSTSGVVTPDTKTVYLNTSSTATSSQAVALASNSYVKTGYVFGAWAAGSVGGTQYAAGANYNPNISYNSSTFKKTVYAIWRDIIPPTITFDDDGSDNKWIKTAISTISVSDNASGVDNSTLKFVFSKSSSIDLSSSTASSYSRYEATEDVIAKFSNNGTFRLSGKDGIYYLHAYACDNAGNCTTKVSQKFKLDNTPPTLECRVGNKVEIIHYQLDSDYEEILKDENGNKIIVTTRTVEIQKDASTGSCHGYHYLLLRKTQASRTLSCTDAFTASDNSGSVTLGNTGTKHYDDDGNTKCTWIKSNGNSESCIRMATACNCIHDDLNKYCRYEDTCTARDEAGNTTSDAFVVYVRYKDPDKTNKSFRNSYCTTDRQPNNSNITESK